MKYCPQCGTPSQDSNVFCTSCGHKLQPAAPAQETKPASGSTLQGESVFDALTEQINRLSGGQGVVRPPLRTIFSELFQRHTQGQSEEIFICGTASSTPRLEDLRDTWPKPWLFSRVFFTFLATFLLLYLCCSAFGNVNALPGLIIVGSFMAPISILVFFFEVNMTKNISFFTTIKVFMVGGCASLLFTLLLFSIVPVGELDYLGAILVGIIEEVGKLGIVYFFLKKEKNTDYLVNGMLIGAAIGAGFAAFESAGYAYRYFASDGYGTMLQVIALRCMLALGGHVVWAAISGYALMLAKGDGPLSFSVFKDKRFWQLFWIPVALHAIWDMPISLGTDIDIIPILLIIAAWVVVFVLLDNCLKQVASKVQALRSPAEGAETDSDTEGIPTAGTKSSDNICKG